MKPQKGTKCTKEMHREQALLLVVCISFVHFVPFCGNEI